MALLLWYCSYYWFAHSVTYLWYGHKLGMFTFYWNRFIGPSLVKEGHFSWEKTTGAWATTRTAAVKTSLKVNLLPFHFFTAVHFRFGSRYSPFLICSPPLQKFSCISSPSFSSPFFISRSSSFSVIHLGVEIRIKSKKRLGFLQLQIHLHLRMHGVHNLQTTVIFLVHESGVYCWLELIWHLTLAYM